MMRAPYSPISKFVNSGLKIQLAWSSWCIHEFLCSEHQKSRNTNTGDTNSTSRIPSKHRFWGWLSNSRLRLAGYRNRRTGLKISEWTRTRSNSILGPWIPGRTKRMSRIWKPIKYVARPLQTKMTDFWRLIQGSFRTETKKESRTINKKLKLSKRSVNMLEYVEIFAFTLILSIFLGMSLILSDSEDSIKKIHFPVQLPVQLPVQRSFPAKRRAETKVSKNQSQQKISG